MTSSATSFIEKRWRPYGQDLAANFGAEDAPHVVTNTLHRAELAVTELLIVRPPGRVSEPIVRQDAYMICCQFRDKSSFGYWEEGRALETLPLQAGDTTIHDLRLEPLAMLDKPVHTLLWFLPQTALNALADEASVSHIDELRFDPCVGIADETIRDLSILMLPALRTPKQVNRLFADHVTLALAAHVAHAYGGMRTAPRLVKGGLAPWQERRAKEILAADLTGSTPLTQVAAACGLSVGHFSRAFRRSTGLAPHAWLLQLRVDRAMPLLRQRNQPLSEIAVACGFVDQSHFTRVFVQRVGLTPGAWRRINVG